MVLLCRLHVAHNEWVSVITTGTDLLWVSRNPDGSQHLINAQFLSMPINTNQNWAIDPKADQYRSLPIFGQYSGSMPGFWLALIGNGDWSRESLFDVTSEGLSHQAINNEHSCMWSITAWTYHLSSVELRYLDSSAVFLYDGLRITCKWRWMGCRHQ